MPIAAAGTSAHHLPGLAFSPIFFTGNTPEVWGRVEKDFPFTALVFQFHPDGALFLVDVANSAMAMVYIGYITRIVAFDIRPEYVLRVSTYIRRASNPEFWIIVGERHASKLKVE